MSRPALRSWVSTLLAFALTSASTLVAPPVARANDGVMYGAEDARVFGDPKADPTAVLGYCVPWSVLAMTHIGLTRVIDRSRSGGSQGRVGFDLTMGVRCGRSVGGNPGTPGLVILPQIGYSLEDRQPGPILHFFRMGVGVGFGNSMATIAYVPRLLIGGNDGDRLTGIRQGIVLSLAADLITAEISHQVLFTEGPGNHRDLRVGGSFNLLMLAYLLAH